MSTTSDCRPPATTRGRWAARFLAWQLWAAVAGVLGLVLAVSSLVRPGWAVEPASGRFGMSGWAWLLPTPGNQLWTVAFVGAAVMAAYRAQKQPSLARYREVIVISVPAALTVVLGLAAYVPCAGGYSWASLMAWTLNLFAGQLEGDVFGDGTACPGAYPLGFQIARMTGLATLVAGAVATVAALSQQQVDRWRIRDAADVDIVVGVDPNAVGLTTALLDEQRTCSRYPDWHDVRLDEKKALDRRGRRQVVVIHPNGDEPALGELREYGARVLVGDPTDREVLRVAMVRRRGGRIAVHRLFAATPSQQVNLAVVDVAKAVLDGAGLSQDDWLSQESVPRLVAVLDDPREARDWQLTQLGSTGFFVDALSVDALLARSIVGRLAGLEPRRVLLLGDSPLTVAVLDELALQRYFRAELDANREACGMARLPGRGLVDVAVTLVGVRAELIRAEWMASSAPCGQSLPVVCSHGSWEEAAVEYCPSGVPVAIVITDPPSRTITSQATRLTRMHPYAVVFEPRDNVDGVEPLPSVPCRSVVHFGPSLLQDGDVPEDSWTVLAHQQHQWWGTVDTDPGDDRAARRGWGRPSDPAARRLPEFYRDDNLRQLRHVLRAVRLLGYQWRPVTRDDQEAAVLLRKAEAGSLLTEADALMIAEQEHARWYRLRVASGWEHTPHRPAPGLPESDKHAFALRHERARLHADLVGWGELSDARRSANAEAVQTIVGRLYQWGIVPVRSKE
ncbi:MAG: hypothetical protein WCF12_03585 [Propionicimonas sp.]